MRSDHVMIVLTSVLVTLLALAPIGFMAYRSRPPSIATVDLQKLVEEEEKRTIAALGSGQNISAEQRATLEKLTIDFAKRLSSSIDALGAECKCVIVNKAALLGGVTIDYTDLVRERMGH